MIVALVAKIGFYGSVEVKSQAHFPPASVLLEEVCIKKNPQLHVRIMSVHQLLLPIWTVRYSELLTCSMLKT